ncbi:MAG: DUF4249 family protein [Paludibacteraceae bacterium]|nr:DUF4249 family protein [Paludibacteraceae bacterium]
MKRLASLLSFVLLLASCQTEIQYNGKITEPELVAFADAASGRPLTCYVQQSSFFLNADNNYPDYKIRNQLADATVHYCVNNGEWLTLPFVGNCFSDSANAASVIHAGETLRVRVSHPDYGTTEAEQTLPQPVEMYFTEQPVREEAGNNNQTVYTVQLQFDPYWGDSSAVGMLVGSLDMLFPRQTKEGYDTIERVVPLQLSSADFMFSEMASTGGSAMEELFNRIENNGSEQFSRQLQFPVSVLLQEGRTVEIRFKHNYSSYNSPNQPVLKSLIFYCHVYTKQAWLYRMTTQSAQTGSAIGFGIEEPVQVMGNFPDTDKGHKVIGVLLASSSDSLKYVP